MGNKRDFKGVWIPKEIWLSPELTAMEKMMWAEINSLDNDFGCVADNKHFQDTFSLSERQVRDYIKRLKDLELINVEHNKAKNTRTINIIGKYKRTPEETLKDIKKWRSDVVDRFRAD
jgi:hypothetical protein